jgi:hypothetical protein
MDGAIREFAVQAALSDKGCGFDGATFASHLAFYYIS